MITRLEALTLTTDAAEAAEGFIVNRIPGRVVAIKYAFGDLVNTADLTITGETTGLGLLAYTNIPAANAWFFPVTIAQTAAAGQTDSTLTEVPVFVIEERIKVVIAEGGDTKTGTITVYVDQGS